MHTLCICTEASQLTAIHTVQCKRPKSELPFLFSSAAWPSFPSFSFSAPQLHHHQHAVCGVTTLAFAAKMEGERHTLPPLYKLSNHSSVISFGIHIHVKQCPFAIFWWYFYKHMRLNTVLGKPVLQICSKMCKISWVSNMIETAEES